MAHMRFVNSSRRTLAAVAIAGFLSFLVAIPQQARTEGATSGVIEVLADHAKLFRLPRAAATIIVGNPLVADVNVAGGKLLVITGKTYGTTNLIALDGKGKEIGHYNLYVKTSGIHKLTLQKGSGRISYTCAPRCERELQVGDSGKAFKALSSAIGTKTNTAKGLGKDTPAPTD